MRSCAGGALAFTEIAPRARFLLQSARLPARSHGAQYKGHPTIVFVQPGEAHYQSRMIGDLKSHGGFWSPSAQGRQSLLGVDLHVRLDGIDRFEAMGIRSFTSAK